MPVLDCKQNPDSLGIGVGIFLVVGTIVAFIPQEVEFFKKKSSVGLSLFSIAMGAISNLFTFFNGLFENWDLFVCCQSLVGVSFK